MLYLENWEDLGDLEDDEVKLTILSSIEVVTGDVLALGFDMVEALNRGTSCQS